MPCPVTSNVPRAAELIRAGGLVAFPTETVYGLGAAAANLHAVARLFEIKGRPRIDPLIVHVADRSQAQELAADFPREAIALAQRFWPGPLTLVLPKRDVVPDLVTAGLATVAIRVPDHPMALELLRLVERPVAAPSANLFGRLSPTSAEHVAESFADHIDLILDGGPCRVGLESTVLMLGSQRPILLRAGGIALEDLEPIVGRIHVPEPGDAPQNVPHSSPGMLPRHYAPRTPLYLHQGDPASMKDAAEQLVASRQFKRSRRPDRQIGSAPRIGLLSFTPLDGEFTLAAVEVLSSTGNLREAAANFFSALRRLDTLPLDVIVALPLPDEGLGRAMNDRLRRAAHRPQSSETP